MEKQLFDFQYENWFLASYGCSLFWQFLLPQFIALTLLLIVQYLLWSDFSILNFEVLSINDLNLWSALLAVLT